MNLPHVLRRLRRLPEQITRLGILLLLLVTTTLVVRFVLIPDRYTNRELQVSSATALIEELPIHYAGVATCAECHDEVYREKLDGYHKGLACETCHGPAAAHAQDPDEAPPPMIPRQREHCARCHAFDPARPTGFPQINPATHNPLRTCLQCHEAHSPKPPEVPKECSACHGTIARTKAVSPHSLLQCTQCHDVPEQHKVTPRAVFAAKPTTRTFCLKCHAQDADPAAVPNHTPPPHVDPDHGQTHLCWQCHYPHMPELK